MPPKKGSKKADTKQKKDSSKKSDAAEKDSKKDEAPKAPKFENHLDQLLEALKSDLLHELLEANNSKLAKNSSKKKLVEAFSKVASDNGRKFFFEKLSEDKELLKQAATAFGEVDHDSKSRFVTDLKKKYDELGQVEFFKKQTVDTLNKFCSALGFKEEDSSKDELVSVLGEELLSNGAQRAFEGMKKEFLMDVARCIEIEVKGSKAVLVKRIVGQVYSHLLEETVEEEKKDKDSKKKDKPSVDKKPIEKGISSEELYQYYTEELAEYAGKHNLSKSGTKKDLIKRIKNFLNMTPEDLAKSQEKKKKKRRRPAGAGPKRKTKKSTKEGEQKDAATKKAAGGRKRKSEGSSASSDSDAKKQKTA